METFQLAAEDLGVGFGKSQVASHINLTVETGEVVVLAGPNGAGKSTLIKAMARQQKTFAGTVKLNGTDIWELSTAEFAGKVAYVPQSLEPGQDMTVEEIVMLGRNPHQAWWQWYGSAEDKSAVESALAATEMLPHRKKYLSQLSGGERQRACLATALAQEPKLMLLDEPTAHLDFRHQLELVKQLKELKARNIGCLVVLHDLNLTARTADKVILLQTKEGTPSSVLASGPPSTVLTRENLASVFQVDVHIFDDPETGQPVYNPTTQIADRSLET